MWQARTRREFLKTASFSATALGMTTTSCAKVAKLTNQISEGAGRNARVRYNWIMSHTFSNR